MDRTVFAARFSEAAEQSRAFAQTLVSEPLPGDVVVRVRLNRSYPGARLRPGEVTYPGDGGWEQESALRRCGLGTAVGVLWRDGRVPEWVNLTVVDRDESVTVIEAVCCGRFTDDDALLYRQSGPPPFHVLGPPLPPGHDGSRYSLHRRSECWDQADLARLHGTHPLVRSLAICTSEFDADGLAALPALEGMTELRHRRYAAAGDPVAAIARFPRLRTARIHLTGTVGPAISGHAANHTVEAFALSGLPDAAWGFANQLAGTRRIRALHLRGTPLSDALALALPARLGLEFLDLVDTGVTTATIEQIAAAHPSLRLLPSPRPTTPEELKIRYPRPALGT